MFFLQLWDPKPKKTTKLNGNCKSLLKWFFKFSISDQLINGNFSHCKDTPLLRLVFSLHFFLFVICLCSCFPELCFNLHKHKILKVKLPICLLFQTDMEDGSAYHENLNYKNKLLFESEGMRLFFLLSCKFTWWTHTCRVISSISYEILGNQVLLPHPTLTVVSSSRYHLQTDTFEGFQ